MKPLNQISKSRGNELTAIYSESIDDAYPLHGRQRAYEILGSLAWLNGDIESLHKNYTRSVELGIRKLNQRSERRPKASPKPLAMEMICLNGVIVQDKKLREQIAQIPLENWYTEGDKEYLPLALALNVVRNFSVIGKCDQSDIEGARAANQKAESYSAFRSWIDVLLNGLAAITDNNDSDAQQAVNKLLAMHELDALDGEWQWSVRGLVASWATALLQLAKEADLELDWRSRYVPVKVNLDLIESISDSNDMESEN